MNKIIIILLIGFVFISGCCDDPIEIFRYEFDDEELALIPYESGSKISFIHSNGYEFEFDVISRTTIWEEQHPFCEWSCCGKEYFSYQQNITVLKTNYPNLEIKFIITAAKEFVDRYENNTLNIDINNNHYAVLHYDEIYSFQNDTSLTHYETIILNEKEYNNVYEIELNPNFIQDTSFFRPKSILYDKLNGLLQIKTSNNETYTIK